MNDLVTGGLVGVVIALVWRVYQLQRKTSIILQILQKHHEELYENTRSPFTPASYHDQQLPLN